MRKLLLLICLVALPCASSAQDDHTWANLNTLRVGQQIQIVERSAKKDSGTFVSVSDAAITFQDAAGERTIQKQDVRSVKRVSSRGRHTLIGAAIGFGAGAGIGAGTPIWTLSSHPTVGNRVENMVGVGMVGFGMGAIVGALLPTHSTVYRVSSH